MVQQMIDSKFSEFGLVNPVNNSPACDKQCPVGAKKTPLRDLQNENRVVPDSTGSSPFSKDRGICIDPIKVSGTKRASPECPLSPSQCQSPSNTAANGPLVYVRRKCETELAKSSAFDCTGTSNFQQMRQVTQPEEIYLLKSKIKESKVSCSPAFAPLPMASLTSSSAKPSVPLPLGKSATKLTPLDSNQLPVVATTPLFDCPKGISELHWEERYYHLQMLLKKLDQSNLEDYTQTKELQRVSILNALGKTTKMAPAPITQTDQSCK
ncbi:Ubiquitin family protein isoform 1 [Hibiscus syriacus]|uniref:Ubiquitin family protein isoform 1 n=1 Tax=Hibiscus syriacus TaxID=106335 RepID=A0A6A3A6D9_HIBSY|nr:Ubiquitin family protein isoform 1 [Hibiscus syriacus]